MEEKPILHTKRSGLRQPTPTTRLPQLSASTSRAPGLQEVSDSQNNSRAQTAIMAPSAAPNLKRPAPLPVSASEPKRKTMADRAGTEFRGRQKPGPPNPARSMPKGSSLKEISSKPAASGNRSISYSRHASKNSYSSSVGQGSRPPSVASKNGRPATSMTVREDEPTKNAWDVDARLGTFETEFKAMKDMINSSISGQKTLEEDVAAVRQKATDLDRLRDDLEEKKSALQTELDEAERRIYALTRDLEDEKRARRNDRDDLTRSHRNLLEGRERDIAREKDELERSARKRIEAVKEELAIDFAKQLGEAHKAFEDLEKLLEDEKRNALLRNETSGKNLEVQLAQLEDTRRELDRARRTQDELNALLARKEARITDLEHQVVAGQTALIHLKGNEQEQLQSFRIMSEEKEAALDRAAKALKEAEEAKGKLRKEERRRRQLFEQLQTLKGNIRVMCRIRPGRNESTTADIKTDVGDYDDHIGKMTVNVPSKNCFGDEIVDPKAYDFERVFEPTEDNKAVFEEISQLVQSALDGQRVCIFCYGQTGSGKTYTMSSGEGAIIPSAVKMIYEQAEAMKDAGWTYQMYGSFTEVYNEKLYDLLGPDGTRNQVDLRQHPGTKKFYVDSEAKLLESPNEVAQMLEQAAKNRTVAATKMNRESSRSHSVFALKLCGEDVEGNKSEGVLNLIDLAGSERVKDSQVEGINFKETANINTSLSTLSQVMMALAENQSHVPYRNSVLTKLLEGCLGGNAKALMFVMVSPLMDDIRETISSLDFATTVSKAKLEKQAAAGPKAAKTGSGGRSSAVPKKR